MARNIAFLLVTATLVASCGTPQEQCIRRGTDEYRTINRLLAEVEGNLARGYAWEERVITRTELDECPTIVRTKDGERQIVYRSCFRDVTDTERYRVPIDPLVETRKRDNLIARKAALTPAARAAVDACKAEFPEEKS
jgi:hypothetical protein